MGHSDGAKTELSVVPVSFRQPPAAPKGLLAETKSEWKTFWESDQSRLVQPAHLPLLKTMFELQDERRRLLRVIGSLRLVPGSTGQPSLNPIYTRVRDVEKALLDLSAKFGGTPRDLHDLGISFGEAMKSLDELNREAKKDAAGGDDPRFAALQQPARDE